MPYGGTYQNELSQEGRCLLEFKYITLRLSLANWNLELINVIHGTTPASATKHIFSLEFSLSPSPSPLLSHMRTHTGTPHTSLISTGKQGREQSEKRSCWNRVHLSVARKEKTKDGVIILLFILEPRRSAVGFVHRRHSTTDFLS